MSAIRELDQVVLTAPLPSDRLVAGDVSTVVLVHREGEAFEVEFVTLTGEAVAIETLLAHQIRPVRPSEVLSVRDTFLQEERDS